MPTAEDLKKRSEARALRRANQQSAIEKAHTEAADAAEKQQQNQKGRDATAELTNVAPKPKAKPTPRAETVRKGKAAAEVQARKDSELTPEEVNVEQEFERWDGRGAAPLHVLNAIAKRIDGEVRDEGREIAAAAGKAAYEVYTGKLGGKRNRYGKMRAQIAAGQAKLDADKAKAADTNANNGQ
jgi:hypothetical protein